MLLSLTVDAIWYILQWNGNTDTVSQGTAFSLQLAATGIILLSNIMGLLYGWKLRRIVKSMRHQRACDRATMAEIGTVPPLRESQSSSFSALRSFRLTSNAASPSDKEVAANREITIGVDAKEAAAAPYCPNEIVTSKYTFYNFLFVFLQLQFSRLANVYTTVIVFLCFFDFSPVSPVASLTPLLIVFVSSAIKDVTEDLKRQKADAQVNGKPIELYRRVNAKVERLTVKWRDVQVGDIVLMKDGDEASSDLLILSTSRDDGRCYVATANLDGESNTKIRSVPSITRKLTTATEILENHTIKVECDAPNRSLFDFNGRLVVDQTSAALSMDNVILRGSDLCSSEWTLALVIYTGKETRIALNGSTVPQKRSRVEKVLNSMFILILTLLFSIAVACSLGNNSWNFIVAREFPWYLTTNPEDDADYNNFVFLSYVILFNNMIPLSMYVTMEGVRFLYARYVENDLEMYHEESDTPAQARNSNIMEDLGQIQYIFSDKTGTLTQNEMIFSKCSVAGLKYGDVDADGESDRSSFPGTQFTDARLLSRLDNRHGTASDIHEFLLLLMLCNTVIPSIDPETSEIRMQASSPDEEALVFAAYALGYKLERRDGATCYVNVRGEDQVWEILAVLEFNSDRKRMSVVCKGPDEKIRLYCKGADNVILQRLSTDHEQAVTLVTVGHLHEYAAEGLRTLTGAVKIMDEVTYSKWQIHYAEASMSVRDRSAKVAAAADLIECNMHLLGATAIEDRLQDGVADCISSLRAAGINFWVLTGDKKETAISVGLASQVMDDTMDVILLGQSDKSELTLKLEELYVDLVEDKWITQEDSASKVLWETTKQLIKASIHTISDNLAGGMTNVKTKRRCRQRAGTGGCRNRLDTATDETIHDLNSMEIVVDVDKPVGDGMERERSAAQSEEDDVLDYAMVIDGQTLTMLLQDDIKYLFLAVARKCKSVICCRCSPAQKAAVVTLVTQPRLMWGPGFLSLSIGDGANDVPMIQAASVGVGISGKEGRQAVLSSDFSIAQFKYLKRLLLVHGNYSYKRISKLILFSFMKNMALSISNFWFAIQTRYSGLLMYFGILFTLYNALFTTIPIFFVALYNQDVPTAVLMQHPRLYHNGLHNRSFNWVSFFGWCTLGVWHAYVIFEVAFVSDGYYRNYTKSSQNPDAFLFSNTGFGLWADGTAAYTYLVVASTVQVSLLTSNWTKYNVAAVIGTVVFYFLFIWFLSNLFTWTSVDIYESARANGIVTVLSQEPWFWLGMLLSAIATVLPNYILKAGRVLFYPEPSHLMREWNKHPSSSEGGVHAENACIRPKLVRRNTGYAFSHHQEEPRLIS